jgi:simple sugar transport system substrate-binding protein
MATVSNALGGRRSVAPALVARVAAAVQELGYVADLGASRLRSRKPAVAGIMVPDLINPFFAALVAAVETEAQRDGFDLVVASSGDDPARQARRLKALAAWRPAGIIVVPCDDSFAVPPEAAAGVPLVLADRIPAEPGCDAVGIDNEGAAGKAMTHLLSRGHRAVLVVASLLTIANVRERCAGIRAAALAAGVPEAVGIIEAGHALDVIRARLAARLAEGTVPTAIFALNNMAALGAMEALAARGLGVPADVSLVSFDDYDWMRIVSPPITAVRQPVEALGAAAWRCLTARLGNDDAPYSLVRLACSLEIRASSGPARRRLSPRAQEAATVREWSKGGQTMTLTRRTALTLAAGTATAGLLPGLAGRALAQGKEPQIAVVVKIGGIPWFNAMEEGIKKASAEQTVNAWQVGPTQADAAQQVRAVEDLIARKVDVIAVVPNDATALEPVFKRAKEAGIIVLTHESPDQKFNDWDIELTSVAGFGETHMEGLAKAMGEEGKYIVYVGSLTVPLHNKWADAAIALQKAKYPKMQLVADRFGVAESLDDSYKTALDQMRANPDLKGILAFGSQGPIGAARAVDERGKIGKIAVLGPFSPGQGAKYIKSGAISEGFIWNPMLAGQTIVRVANMIVQGQQPTDGMDLPDLGKVHVDTESRNILAQKLQPINKDTIDELVSMGL